MSEGVAGKERIIDYMTEVFTCLSGQENPEKISLVGEHGQAIRNTLSPKSKLSFARRTHLRCTHAAPALLLSLRAEREEIVSTALSRGKLCQNVRALEIRCVELSPRHIEEAIYKNSCKKELRVTPTIHLYTVQSI